MLMSSATISTSFQIPKRGELHLLGKQGLNAELPVYAISTVFALRKSKIF